VGAVAGHGIEHTLEVMEKFLAYSEMKVVGKLGAITGMDDVGEKPDIMEQARQLGLKIKAALKDK